MSDNTKSDRQGSIYIAGPMRGQFKNGVPTFALAAHNLRAQGWSVANPVEIGKTHGIETMDKKSFTPKMRRKFARIGFPELLKCDAICMLPGWRKSQGAVAELAAAEFAGLVSYEMERGLLKQIEKDDSILHDAHELVNGDRNAHYGPPNQDFDRTAKIWSALKGVDFTPSDVARFMIAVKLSRWTWSNKRDHAVDIAGYAECGHRCDSESERLAKEEQEFFFGGQ